jgi:hypothetical protein
MHSQRCMAEGMLMRLSRAQSRWLWRCEESFGEEARCEAWYEHLHYHHAATMLIIV